MFSGPLAKQIAGIAILIIIVGAVCGIVLIGLPAMGIAVPVWIVNIIWILVVALVCIGAIRLLVSGTPGP